MRTGFHLHQRETDPERIAALLQQAEADLQMLRRQTQINNMFTRDRLVLEPL